MADFEQRNQFLVKKEKTEDTSEKVNSSIRRHRRVTFYKIALLIGLLVIILLGLRYQWKNHVYTGYQVISESAFHKSAETRCIELQKNIFSYSKDGMSCTDTKGKVVWNQTYEMKDPLVRSNANIVAVGEYNGREIHIASTTEILGKIETTMPIRDFCVAGNGVVAAVLDDTTVTAIYLYSVSGEQLAYFKTTMSKSGYPMAIDITEDGKQVAVSYIKAEDGKVTSNIGFYNFSAVGQNYTDNLVGAYGYKDAVIPIVSFMNNDAAFGVADHRLMFFSGKQKPVNSADIWIENQIQSIFYDKNYVGLVFYNPTGESEYLLHVYDTKGNQVMELPFQIKYSNISFQTDGVIIYNETECVLYDWKKKLKYQGTFPQKLECMIQTGKTGRYMLVLEDAVQMIQMH